MRTEEMRVLIKSLAYCHLDEPSDRFYDNNDRSTRLKLVAYLDEHYWRQITDGVFHNSPSYPINQMMTMGCDEEYYYYISEELDSEVQALKYEIDTAINLENRQ